MNVKPSAKAWLEFSHGSVRRMQREPVEGQLRSGGVLGVAIDLDALTHGVALDGPAPKPCSKLPRAFAAAIRHGCLPAASIEAGWTLRFNFGEKSAEEKLTDSQGNLLEALLFLIRAVKASKVLGGSDLDRIAESAIKQYLSVDRGIPP